MRLVLRCVCLFVCMYNIRPDALGLCVDLKAPKSLGMIGVYAGK